MCLTPCLDLELAGRHTTNWTMTVSSTILQRLCLALSVFHIGSLPRASLAFNPSSTIATRWTSSVTSRNTVVDIKTWSKNNIHQDNINGRNNSINKHISKSVTYALQMSSSDDVTTKSSLPVFLDPGTKGGVVVLSIILFRYPDFSFHCKNVLNLEHRH
jgi:hypothetical protein